MRYTRPHSSKEPDTLEAKRVFVLATSIYGVEDYPAVKDFFQKVNAKDQEQAVLQPAAATTAQRRCTSEPKPEFSVPQAGDRVLGLGVGGRSSAWPRLSSFPTG